MTKRYQRGVAAWSVKPRLTDITLCLAQGDMWVTCGWRVRGRYHSKACCSTFHLVSRGMTQKL